MAPYLNNMQALCSDGGDDLLAPLSKVTCQIDGAFPSFETAFIDSWLYIILTGQLRLDRSA